ncbi:MAG: FAD-binding protein [Candidatus Zixiibacteriota bacterium]|jgi:FAD/FMN-containing dehydrogenase
MRDELVDVLGSGAVRETAGRVAAELADEAAARQLADLCRERGWKLHPWAGTADPSPGLPDGVVLVAAGPALAGDFTLAAEDYYCEAPAGMTLDELSSRLANTPLFLPFVAPGSAAMTAAEAVARYPANAFAPAYGEFPRLLYGLTFVNDDGDLVTVGRRTIKGVAGYDVSKLFLGSRGRAGLIVRLRFRLFLRPGHAACWRAAAGSAPAAGEAGGRVCPAETGEGVLFYADGHPTDLDSAAERLRATHPDLQDVAAGPEAVGYFSRAAAGEPYVPAGGDGGSDLGVSDLFV